MTAANQTIVAPHHVPVHPVTLRRVLTSEWVKVISLPAYVISFAAAFVVLVGFGLLSAWARVLQATDAPNAAVLEPGALLAGLQGTQLLVAITAAVFATSEHAQGTVQPTYLSVPTRLPVLAAKAMLVAGMGFTIGTVGATLALLGAPPILTAAGLPFEMSTTFAIQLVLGAGFYLAAVSVLGLAIGSIIRSTVGGLLTVLGLLTIAPLVLGGVPVEWIRDTAAYLPSTAGLLILQTDGASPVLGPWAGLGIAGVWGAAALIVAAITVRATDA